MAEQSPESHQPVGEEEQAGAVLAAEEAVEPPLASADIQVQQVSASALAPAPAVSVVEKEVPLSLAQPPTTAVLAEEKVSVTSSSGPLGTQKEAAAGEGGEGFLPKPVPPPGALEEGKKIGGGPESWVSFKEESNVVSDLTDFQRKALEELKSSVQEGLKNNAFTAPLPAQKKKEEISSEGEKSTQVEGEKAEEKSEISTSGGEAEEVSIWGIPLMKDDRSDVILLKFLRARDFDVKKAFLMLQNTLIWRKQYNVDGLIDEDLGDDLDKVVFMHGHDKDGHPVCYNVYGEFQNKELYNKTFADEEKRKKFLRWRIQFLEKSIRKLDFRPGGINTIFQVSDLKNSPGPGKRELRIATRQALQLLQDNYPEFVAKQVFINVPWWYLAFYTMIGPFLTQRTKSKFVFAGPARTAETLFKYISPEQVPIQYGGLSVDFCECNPEFTVDDPAPEITIKPATKQTVEITVNEKCVLVWELRVVGWEVSYSAEYVPDTPGSYTVIIQKPRKMSPTDEPVISHSFKITELGKILLTIDNPTTKKKKLLYRRKKKRPDVPDSSLLLESGTRDMQGRVISTSYRRGSPTGHKSKGESQMGQTGSSVGLDDVFDHASLDLQSVSDNDDVPIEDIDSEEFNDFGGDSPPHSPPHSPLYSSPHSPPHAPPARQSNVIRLRVRGLGAASASSSASSSAANGYKSHILQIRTYLYRQTTSGRQIDKLTPDQVEWLPYGPDPFSDDPRTIYSGWIQYQDIIEPYLPSRVLCQIGYIQVIPPPIPHPLSANRSGNHHAYKSDHDKTACAPNYLQWYLKYSHPFLVLDATTIGGVRTTSHWVNPLSEIHRNSLETIREIDEERVKEHEALFAQFQDEFRLSQRD
ncbi:OLC1v1015848C1 [Oldenlandia corymbosa var. corymbosa]|uniref:OLC1v1015848C1 n=1 Tax=Oldenlandia corymbosa var. corymbosa TaxID=529605 RepID=A0AAV1E4E9_OLDCO|nr:OLC1v1015848C1 [Oldenlandia corymbosa var. corymbosa]